MDIDLTGNIPPLVTPVTDRDGELDFDTHRNLVESLIEGGADGVLACGTSGEFMSLTSPQRRSIIRATVEAANDVPVMAGCGDDSLRRTKQHLSDAQAAGADVGLVLTPWFWTADPSGLAEFYTRIADASPLPIMIYHLPDLTGQSLPVDTVIELAEHDWIVGIKDTSRDLVRCHAIVERTGPSFHLFQGSLMLVPQSIGFGADGLVASPANIFPTIHSTLYEASVRGDEQTVSDIMHSFMLPYLANLSTINMIAAVKYMLELQGFAVGPPLPPMMELTSAEKRTVEYVFDEFAEMDSPVEPIS